MILFDGAPPTWEPIRLTATGTSTLGTKKERYDWLTDQLLEWVREVPLESDAVNNIPRILEQYEKRKTFWQKFKSLFL